MGWHNFLLHFIFYRYGCLCIHYTILSTKSQIINQLMYNQVYLKDNNKMNDQAPPKNNRSREDWKIRRLLHGKNFHVKRTAKEDNDSTKQLWQRSNFIL